MKNLKKKIIFEDRWTFKSFIRILESCQKQNSSLRRYEIIMELLSLLDPIWKIQKNKNHEKHDDGKNYARKFSEDTSTRPIPNNIKDKANDYYLNPPKLSDNFKEFIKKFNENQLLYFLEKIFVLEMEIENVLYSTELKQILDFIKENDLENIIIYSLLDTCAHRENKDAPNLTKDFFIADERLYSKKTRKIEILTKPPRLLVEHYKKRDKAEYDRLQQALNISNGKVFIQGLSGLGKSEFAKEFWKNSLITKSFRYFAWIDFKDDLETSFYQQYFLADDKNTTESYNRSKLLKIINSMGDKLLVIVDNFLSDEKFQRDKFLEDLCALNCTLLITTTENLEYSGIKKYELGFLSQTNSIDLFETYYTLESNKNKISKIVECLGYHTISIELVSKSCNAEGFTLDRTLDFLSENDLNYSDVEVSINHPRLVTNESVSKHLGTLFSIMMKSLNNEALELLIKFSIFKTIPFPLEDIKILFGIESAKPLLRLVKSGWIRAEKLPGHYKGDYYSIHLVAALVVINKFDIFPYFEKFRQKIRNLSLSANNPLEQNIYIIEIANSFINTFIHSVKSFGFVILLTNYVNLLLAIASVSTVYINTIEQYLKSAKEILKVLDEHDFKIFVLTSDLENSYLLNSLLGMDAPYTVKNLKHKLLFLLNNAFLYTLKINMSRDSLNKQEDMALILLRGLPEPSNSLIEYEKLTLNIYLLELYCDYCQKEKIPTFINKIIGLQKKISNHKQSNIVAKLDFIRLESLCYQTIANAYIIIGEYDNAQDYLDKTKETASSYIKAVYPESQNEIGVNDIFVETIVTKYNYSISKLVIFKESGEEAYKKILMEKYENIRNSDLEKHIKIKKCEEILFQYDPFFKEHSNYEGYDF